MTIEPIQAGSITGGDLIPADLEKRIHYAQTLAASNLLPRQYREQPANVLVAMEYGDALGIKPIVAIQSIHVIEGTPSQSANLMATLVRRAGHRLRVVTDERAPSVTATLIRHDDPDFEFTSTWTMDKARTAGLTGKDNWKHHPVSMLRARAISEVCRSGASECLLGVEYIADEVESFDRRPPVQVVQVRDWRAEVDQRRGDYEALKQLHAEAHRAGAFREDAGLSDHFRQAKDAPAPSIDRTTGEVLDAEVIEPTPTDQAQGRLSRTTEAAIAKVAALARDAKGGE